MGLILITGCPASGKTTFAKYLSDAMRIPLFCKDLLKISLAEHISITNRAESRRLSDTTVSAMLSVADSMLAVGDTCLLEANFREEDGRRIHALLEKHRSSCLTFLFGGDTAVLGERFVARDRTEERHPANRMFELETDYSRYAEIFREFQDFAVGDEIVRVDATDFAEVDYERLLSIARKWL